jgi:hypothetical protein
MKIPWKYCECGCHGHEATVGGMYFTTYQSLRKGGKLFLAVGQHHAHLTGKPYNSHQEVDAVIQELLVKRKRELKEQLKQLRDL